MFVNLELLNNIIKLSDTPFIQNHFSVNSEGDMIIDTESQVESSMALNERKFFGIKKNGKEYFTDKTGEKSYYSSIVTKNSYGRNYGQSCFIKVESDISDYKGKEFVLGISVLKDNQEVEIYNLDSGYYYNFSTKSLFGRITSRVFAINQDPLNKDTQFNYFISYVSFDSTKYTFNIKKIYFNYNRDDNIKYYVDDMFQIDVVEQNIISCFFSDNYIYTCFYINDKYSLTILAFNPLIKTSHKTDIYTYSDNSANNFFKCIHLKNNIGFFSYFDNNNIFSFSLYEIYSDTEPKIYKSYNYVLYPGQSYENNEIINDLIKLNNNTVCFLCPDFKEIIIDLIVFYFYDNDNYMNVRHFKLDLNSHYRTHSFIENRLGLFNNFLAISFTIYTEYNDGYNNSLILFCYPNSSDINLDIIQYLYPNNKTIENEIKIDIENKLVIENNLFGYIFKGTKIIKYSEEISLIINNDIIKYGTIIEAGEVIRLKINSKKNYNKGNYTIEFAYVLTEADYDTKNDYLTFIDGTYGNEQKNEKEFYQKNEYIGKHSNFSVIISENLTTECEYDYCSLCYANRIKECITCKYTFDFNEKRNIKICHDLKIEYTTEVISPSTTIISQYETQLQENTITQMKTTEILNEKISTLSSAIINQYVTQFKENTIIPMKTTEILNEKTFTELINEQTTNIKFETTDIISEEVKEETKHIKMETTDIITEELKEEMTNIIEYKNDEVLSDIYDFKITNEQIETVYNELKLQIKANTTNKIIKTENVIFQISSLKEQKGNDIINVSSIDLGECEKILKNNSGLTDDEDLIIFKIDIKNEDLSATYVQYEIYNPLNFELMSLDICKDILITVRIPINLNEETQNIYDSLVQSGYNLFDINDNFYNDICSTYTTENGTDLTLADRKNIIYDNNGNISMCQKGCEFILYNLTTKKSECNCAIQTTETIINVNELNFEFSSLSNEFFNTINNSNFRVLKCFKLVFSRKGQKKNIGSYIMTGLCTSFLILLLIYIIKENSKVNNYIKDILKQKYEISNSNDGNEDKSKKNNIIFAQNNPINAINEIKIKNNEIKIKNNNNKSTKRQNLRNRKNNKSTNSFPPRRKVNNSTISNNSNFKKSFESCNSKQSKTIEEIKTEKNLMNLVPRNKRKKDITIFNIENSRNKSSEEKINNKENNLIQNTQDFMKNYKISDITDEEKNNLEYEIALIVDKRTYFQYYYSLLKKKQLILFAFCPNKDYNLTLIKISLLILSFSLFFTINGFFFTDSTMNKINKEHGKYNFLFQIPQMLYSTLISAVINIILKMLSLSQKQILIIKQEKNYLNAKKTSNSILKCLKIKLSIFFVISSLLMLFFWYFISCFCSVYKNTQKTLIIDTLISFTLSMIYPFGLNLIPGFFRIPALRAQEKNKKYLYIFSGYLAMI